MDHLDLLFFVPLFRFDYKWYAIMLATYVLWSMFHGIGSIGVAYVVGFLGTDDIVLYVVSALSKVLPNVVFAFIYNRQFESNLRMKGFTPIAGEPRTTTRQGRLWLAISLGILGWLVLAADRAAWQMIDRLLDNPRFAAHLDNRSSARAEKVCELGFCMGEKVRNGTERQHWVFDLGVMANSAPSTGVCRVHGFLDVPDPDSDGSAHKRAFGAIDRFVRRKLHDAYMRDALSSGLDCSMFRSRDSCSRRSGWWARGLLPIYEEDWGFSDVPGLSDAADAVQGVVVSGSPTGLTWLQELRAKRRVLKNTWMKSEGLPDGINAIQVQALPEVIQLTYDFANFEECMHAFPSPTAIGQHRP